MCCTCWLCEWSLFRLCFFALIFGHFLWLGTLPTPCSTLLSLFSIVSFICSVSDSRHMPTLLFNFFLCFILVVVNSFCLLVYGMASRTGLSADQHQGAIKNHGFFYGSLISTVGTSVTVTWATVLFSSTQSFISQKSPKPVPFHHHPLFEMIVCPCLSL